MNIRGATLTDAQVWDLDPTSALGDLFDAEDLSDGQCDDMLADWAGLKYGDCVVDALQGFYWLTRNRFLLDCPTPHALHTTTPIVAVGSSPSLDEHLNWLATNQSRLIIICAHSTLPRLLDAGISPTIYCPLERVDPLYAGIPQTAIDVIYGGSPVVPREPYRCPEHLLVAGHDYLYTWAGVREDEMVLTGSYSGVTAASVAACIAKGRPVYLIGQDMSGGHFDGYAHDPPPEDESPMPCYDGMTRPTTASMRIAARQYAGLIRAGANFVQCSPTGVVVDGMTHGALPAVSARNHLCMSGQSTERAVALERIMVDLPAQLERGRERLMHASSIADIAAPRLFGDGWMLWAYLLRSVYAQLSIERRLGREAHIVPWFKAAFANIEPRLRPVLEERADV